MDTQASAGLLGSHGRGQGPSDWSTPTGDSRTGQRARRGGGSVCCDDCIPQIHILLGPQDENLLGCRDFVGQLVKTELRSSWLEWP